MVLRKLSQTFKISLALMLSVFSSGILQTATVYADPPGNNGTIKVGEEEIDNGNANDPHVGCKFDIKWFGFDTGTQTSQVTFEAQAPTAGQLVSPIGPQTTTFTGSGPGNTLDHQQTYTLAFQGAPHETQGYHVKLTVNTTGSQGSDVKHKVFWVEDCEPTPNQPSLSVAASPCVIGDATVSPIATITNTDDNTNASVNYSYSLTGPVTQTGTVNNVTDGQQVTFTLNNLTAGNYTLSITGSDGTTASYSFTIAQCVGVPSGTIGDVVCTEDGGAVTVNYGNDVSATKSVTFTIFVDGNLVHTEVLAAGESSTTTIDELSDGAHIIELKADGTTIASSEFSVDCDNEEGEPLLTFDYDEECTEEDENDGEASVEIENDGTAAANDLTVELYDSEGNLVATKTNVDVPADDETEVVFTGLGPGAYTIKVLDGQTELDSESVDVDECGGTLPDDECPNTPQFDAFVPQGLVKDENGNCVEDKCPLVPGIQTNTTLCPPGQGGGQTLGTSTTATPPQTLSTSTQLPTTIPATGGISNSNPFLIVLASLIAYGAAYFLQGRRSFAKN